MDNASKALIMAGGMLLTMLIVALLMYAWSLFSEYQTSQDDLADIENTAKFNEQFTQYDRKDLLGYEILSLVNKVIDYNERKTTDSKYGNDSKYPYITLTISINNVEKITYDNNNRLFSNTVYKDDEFTSKTRTSTKSSFEDNVIKKMQQALETYGIDDETKANRVAKSIGSIFLTESDIATKANNKKYGSAEAVYQEMVNTYNSATGSSENISFAKNNLVIKNNTNNNKYYVYACQFYEYMQFKRAIFECTNISYDNNVTGRVKQIDFRFTGKIK